MRFYELPETWEDDIQEYEKLVEKYKQGELEKIKLKSHRVPMGVYEQRESEVYMCRIRLPGGAITPKQIRGVGEIAQKYSSAPIHFTTRQEVQIHNVELQDSVKILNELKEIGLATRGGGGNTIRNIRGGAYAGIDDREVFDISPYVQALTTRMVAEEDSWNLPRKIKIAFSGGPKDKGLATVNDIGFIAKIDENGKKGFKVYFAGGLGARPQKAIKLYDFVPEDEVYNIVKGAKLFFDKNGNRKDKHNSRMRFLLNNLGREEFVKRLEKNIEQVRKQNHPPLQIDEPNSIKQGHFEIPLILGNLEPDEAIELGSILRDYGEDIVRVVTNQNLLIRNIEKETVPELKDRIIDSQVVDTLDNTISDSVACTGADTCKLGICLSRNLLLQLKQETEEEIDEYSNINDISLKISGCPNSCSNHHVADIGFIGGAKRHNNTPLPYYNIVMGARLEEDKTKLAESVGALPARAIPEFFVDFLVSTQKNRKTGEEFHEYFQRTGEEKAKDLISRYSYIPDIEENEDYYYDWGAEEQFKLGDQIEGECSAGLFDLIEWEFSKIDEYFEKLESASERQEILRDIVASAARSLLITKGLESETKVEAAVLFKEHFVGTHLEEEYGEIIDRYLKRQELTRKEAEKISQAVKDLYESMDNSLRFPEIDDNDDSDAEPKAEEHEQLSRDFRGVECPMNFVKTKLALEEIEPGGRLKVLLDDGEPIDNVPGSVKQEGHNVLKQEQKGNYWEVIIEKV